ncbi:PEP-CTERM sorting domain-containing protein [Candidatus Poribacteria bacterium]|nr:PEP-CTERM sorting domain-containing protein [Candidatus Poribacteria bacterium]
MKTAVSVKQLLLCVLCVSFVTTAHAVPINLQANFSADPIPAVTFTAGGFSATLAEDINVSPVFLSNDHGLGDPLVIIAGAGVSLIFDYNFVEGVGSNNDEFGAFILDLTGASAGTGFEFFTQTASSGTVSFDLSGLTSEPFIGLQFQLSSFENTDFDSTVTITNVRLESPAVIPEPSTLLLFGVGLIGIAIYSLRSRRAIRGRQRS